MSGGARSSTAGRTRTAAGSPSAAQGTIAAAGAAGRSTARCSASPACRQPPRAGPIASRREPARTRDGAARSHSTRAATAASGGTLRSGSASTSSVGAADGRPSAVMLSSWITRRATTCLVLRADVVVVVRASSRTENTCQHPSQESESIHVLSSRGGGENGSPWPSAQKRISKSREGMRRGAPPILWRPPLVTRL